MYDGVVATSPHYLSNLVGSTHKRVFGFLDRAFRQSTSGRKLLMWVRKNIKKLP